MPKEVRVKKVNPYPIPARIVSSLGPAQAGVLKLTLFGLLAEIGESKIQAGDKIEISLEMPVVRLKLKELGIVVKLYNQFAPPPKLAADQGGRDAPPAQPPGGSTNPKADRSAREFGGVVHLAEIHFKPLSAEGKTKIAEFLKMLGQTSGAEA